MISFKNFLIEQNTTYQKDALSDAQAFELIEKSCSDFMSTSAKTPIIRGMSNRGSIASFLVRGDTGERKSRNTSNIYTIILDEFLPKLGFPKRSKSLICANWENKKHASEYGWPYALIPFNGVKIGVCPFMDMFETPINLFNHKTQISEWNDIFEDSKLNISIFKSFVSSLSKFTSNYYKTDDDYTDDNYTLLANILVKAKIKNLSEEQIIEILNKAYTKPFELTDAANAYKFATDKKREFWIGGKCIAIPLKRYEEYLKTRT